MRYALMLDGSFMLRRIAMNRPSSAALRAQDVVAECDRIRSHPQIRSMDLLRILFYDARPYADSVVDLVTRKPRTLRRDQIFRDRSALLDGLELAPDFALRLGELSYEGFALGRERAARIVREDRPITAEDLRLRIAQKGVDIRIGLDIARLTLRERVEAIVVVTGDSDLIPAFKFARREGVRVYLEPMGGSVKRSLKAHADVVLDWPPATEDPAADPAAGPAQGPADGPAEDSAA